MSGTFQSVIARYGVRCLPYNLREAVNKNTVSLTLIQKWNEKYRSTKFKLKAVLMLLFHTNRHLVLLLSRFGSSDTPPIRRRLSTHELVETLGSLWAGANGVTGSNGLNCSTERESKKDNSRIEKRILVQPLQRRRADKRGCRLLTIRCCFARWWQQFRMRTPIGGVK